MRSLVVPLTLVALVALAAGCNLKVQATSKIATTSVAPTALPVLANVSGLAQAPASLVSNNAGTVIANNGSTVIANHSAGRTLLGTDAPVPVPGATVKLVDALHQPLNGVATATTDNQGRFAFQNVPADRTFFVEVETPTLHLALIVRPEAAAKPLTVDPVTTVVAEHFRKVFADKPTNIEKVDAKELETLTEQVRPAVEAQPAAPLNTSDAAEQVFETIAQTQPAIADTAKTTEEHARTAPDPTPAPTATPTQTPTPDNARVAPTATATPTLSPRLAATPTPTPYKGDTPPTPTPQPPNAAATPTPAPVLKATPTPTPKATPTATPTPKATDKPLIGDTGGGSIGHPAQ